MGRFVSVASIPSTSPGSSSAGSVRRRRAQGGNFSVGACLGHPTPPSLARNGDTGTLDLVVEVDDVEPSGIQGRGDFRTQPCTGTTETDFAFFGAWIDVRTKSIP